MAINPLDAVSAYKQSSGLMNSGSSAGSGGGASFSDALKSFTGDALSSLHAGEKAATQAVTGKADMASVATAIDNAEIVLDEITTFRDKAIAAYQTISSEAI